MLAAVGFGVVSYRGAYSLLAAVGFWVMSYSGA